MRPSEALRLRRDALFDRVLARGASRLRVFGSVPRGQDRDGSNVDLPVDMPAGISLLQRVGLRLALLDALATPLDLWSERDRHRAPARHDNARASRPVLAAPRLPGATLT
jgi:predicted nucleotidyltransferase